jgi:D-arabinose 1-dehydrogenase-like Zn-dependent alcohol dehydrogenase
MAISGRSRKRRSSLGHEVAGVIEAVGDRVSNLKPGDRVGVGWTQATCGECAQCLKGATSICSRQKVTGIQIDGGYSEYVKATARDTVLIPDEISLEEAAPLFCAGLTTFSPLRQLNVHAGQRVVIIGLGGLGHVGVQFAKAMNAETISVARGADKAQLAKEPLGADMAIDSGAEDWVKRVNDLGGADVILATANSAKLMSESIHALAPDGTLVLLAVDSAPLQLPNSGEFIATRRRMMGSTTGSIQDTVEMLALAAKRNVRPMIETYPLAEAPAVIERVRQGKPRFRAVLTVAE